MRMKRDITPLLQHRALSSLYVAGVARLHGTEDLVVAGHRTPILTYSDSNSSRRQNRRTSSPPSARFLDLLPTSRRHRLQRSPDIANRPSSHRQPLSPPNQIERQEPTVTAPACGPPKLRHPSPPHPPHQPHMMRRKSSSSKLFPLLSDTISLIWLSVRVSHFDCCFKGDLNSGRKPLGSKALSSTSRVVVGEISVVDDGGGGGLRRLRATLLGG
jgi:hypothetical protein